MPTCSWRLGSDSLTTLCTEAKKPFQSANALRPERVEKSKPVGAKPAPQKKKDKPRHVPEPDPDDASDESDEKLATPEPAAVRNKKRARQHHFGASSKKNPRKA